MSKNFPPFQAGDTVYLRKDYNSKHRKGEATKVLKVGFESGHWICIVDMFKDRSPFHTNWFSKLREAASHD